MDTLLAADPTKVICSLLTFFGLITLMVFIVAALGIGDMAPEGDELTADECDHLVDSLIGPDEDGPKVNDADFVERSKLFPLTEAELTRLRGYEEPDDPA